MDSLRDLLLIGVVVVTCGVALVRPFAGLLTYLVFSIVNPHSMTWSIAATFHPVQPIALATILGYSVSSEAKRLPRYREAYLLLALWAVFGLSTLTAIYPTKAYDQLTHVSKVLLMAFLSMAMLTSKPRLLQLTRVLALSLGFLGLKAGIFVISTGGQEMVWGPTKSFLEANNSIGAALAMNLPLLFHLRRLENRSWLRHLLTAMMLLSYPAIVCTFSRGAWLSAAAATGLMTWKSRYRWITVTGLLVVLPLSSTLLPERVVNRYEDLAKLQEEDSAQTRLWTWEFCKRVGLANPFTGAGFDFPSEETYRQYYPEFFAWRGRVHVAACHSTWLTVLGEHGVPGFLLWIGLLGACLVSMRRIGQAARRAGADGAWAIALTDMLRAALLAYMVAGTFLDLAYFDICFELVAIVGALTRLMPLGTASQGTPDRSVVMAVPKRRL